LSERDDNLKGIKVTTDNTIKKISFENVSFKYREQKDLMTFNQSFMAGKVNYLK
jgi:ABC-type bacteriocin/lantibiotic exporter with double-glycine peptidase domain